MSKIQFRLMFQIIFVLILSFSLLGGWTSSVSADTCNWQGGNGDWSLPANWSCGHVPTESDDVVIAQVGVGPQINPATTGVGGNSIYISEEALMTINATTMSLTVYTNSFTNDGEIIINGFRDGYLMEGLSINSPFANNGTITINEGYLLLGRGGTHAGSFVGGSGTVLTMSSAWSNQTYTFTADSQIQVPIIQIVQDGGYAPTVNISGDFSPGLVPSLPSDSYMLISGNSASMPVVNITTTSVLMPYEARLSFGILNLPNTSIDINKLMVMFSTLNNPAQLRIMDYLELSSFSLTGVGGILVDYQATTFTLRGGTISGKTLSNLITANWLSGNVTLNNNAVFQNSGTFNAKATTTMTGTSTESFVNDGHFLKSTASTTTTMNIPFTNNGIVETIAGELIFQQGLNNGEDVLIDLGGGTLELSGSLNLMSGDSLIGSGTLSSNLVNAGLVSPGESPGNITVNGNYTQDANGILAIELGGTNAGTQYDQLAVTGNASLAGVLDVSLINGFVPQGGDSFLLMPYASQSGWFSTLNLPDAYNWGIHYGISGLTLSVLATGSISGTVSCNSNHTVFVDLFVGDYTSPPPEFNTTIDCGESYFFTDLPDGTYYVGAWIDLNESGGGPPDPGEPYVWYGSPTAVLINDGESQMNIDLSIPGGYYMFFLPLLLR